MSPSAAAETVDARFERLLAEHGAAIARVAAAYARTASERKDLEQDVALALYRALPSFRAECSERTFVLRIAHNVGVTFSTRRRARATEPLQQEAEDPAPSAESRLDEARRRDALRRAILALPVVHRQPMTLLLEGLSHEEIAEVLGITTNNVAVRLTRARAALRDALGGAR